MHPEERGIQEQIIEHDVVEAPLRPCLVFGLDHLTYLRHSRFRDRGLIAEGVGEGGSTSRVDNPRTNDAITSDSKAWVLVTCLPNRREANAAVVPRSLGRSRVTGPAVVLTVTGRYPLREPG